MSSSERLGTEASEQQTPTQQTLKTSGAVHESPPGLVDSIRGDRDQLLAAGEEASPAPTHSSSQALQVSSSSLRNNTSNNSSGIGTGGAKTELNPIPTRPLSAKNTTRRNTQSSNDDDENAIGAGGLVDRTASSRTVAYEPNEHSPEPKEQTPEHIGEGSVEATLSDQFQMSGRKTPSQDGEGGTGKKRGTNNKHNSPSSGEKDLNEMMGEIQQSASHSIEDMPNLISSDEFGSPPELNMTSNGGGGSGKDGENDKDKKKEEGNELDRTGEDLGLSHEQLLFLVDAPSSLFIFSSKNKIRHAALYVARHMWFKNAILVLIVVNSILLAADQPAVQNPPALDRALEIFEYIFTIAFDIECIVKIVALGFVLHEGSYLRSGWNILDFIIVVTSTIQLFGVGKNYSALRVFRVLRPLRSVSRIKKLKHLIGGLFKALPSVLDNMLLMLFILILFAIAAVQLWMDKLAQRCYFTEAPPESHSGGIYSNISVPFLVASEMELCGGTRSCPSTIYNASVQCQVHRDIYYRRNMNYDNIFTSFLLTLKIMVLDNWPDDLGDAMNVSGGYAAIFFVVLTLVGSFYCVNLFLAILTEGYTAASSRALHEERQRELNEKDKRVARVKDTDTQVNLDDPEEQRLMQEVADALFDQMAKARQAQLLAEEAGAQFMTKDQVVASQRNLKQNPLIPKGLESLAKPVEIDVDDLPQQNSERQVTEGTIILDGENGGQGQELEMQETEELDTFFDRSPSMPQQTKQQAIRDSEGGGEPIPQLVVSSPNSQHQRRGSGGQVVLSGKLINGVPVEFFDLPEYTEIFTDDLDFANQQAELRRFRRRQQLGLDKDNDGDEDGNEDDKEEPDELSRASSMFSDSVSVASSVFYAEEEEDPRHWTRIKVGKFVTRKYVEWFMVAITILNVIALSIDYYGIDKNLSTALDIASIVFTAFFFVEISMKIFAFGWTKTMSKGFNVLDFLLVVVSIPDIALSGGKASGFSALRVFRLLRVLRLMKEIESLQAVIQSVIHSVSSVTYLSLLILLFLYVFAIMGMQLFGTRFGPNENTRDGFGTLWQALLVCFIVVTGEDWTDRMVLAMSGGGREEEITAVVYFVMCYMIGNYILINLFVAIILDKLAEKMEQISEGGHLTAPNLMLPAVKKLRRNGSLSASLSRVGSIQPGASSFSPREGMPMGKSNEDLSGSQQDFKGHKSVQWKDSVSTTPAAAPMEDGEAPLNKEQLHNFSMNSAPSGSMNVGGAEGGSSGGVPGEGSSQGTFGTRANSEWVELKQLKDGGDGDRQSQGTGGSGSYTPSSTRNGPLNSQSSLNAVASPTAQHNNTTGSPKSVAVVEMSSRKFMDHIITEELDVSAKLRKVKSWLTTVSLSPVQGKSLFVFSPENPIRKACLNIVGARAFVLFIDILLFANVIFLCFESPKLNKDGIKVLDIADYIFTITFVLEMIIKIVAWGAWLPKGERNSKLQIDDGNPEWVVYPAYFRDAWNCCDAVVTITGVIGLFVPIFKVFRSLRTIRLIARNESMRIIIVALLQALPNILNGILLGMFVFVVFGIMGVQFFKGEYYKCNDPDVLHRVNCTGMYNISTEGPVVPYFRTEPRRWERRPYHFDHLGASVLALFVVAVGDGWSKIMYDGMDTTHIDGGLITDNQPWMSIFFILAFICTNFFAFNMIIGILINYFSKMKKMNDGSMLMSPEQRMYMKAQSAIEQAMFADELVAADWRISKVFDKILTFRLKIGGSKTRLPLSEFIILFIVIVNVTFIAATHSSMSDDVKTTIDTVGIVCLALFTVEMVVKLVAYFPIQYFTNGWNIFDFTIIFVGWIDVGVPGLPGLSFLRVLRVSKLLRGSGVEKLLQKTIQSFHSFVNVIAVLVLTFFIFAVAGVNLFGKVKLNGALNHNNNFQTVPNSMLVLYQIVTTEGWSDVMTACSIKEPFCDKALDNCGNQTAATIFFCLYMILGAFTVLQLFVAVIVEIFTENTEGIDEVVELFVELKAAWTEKFGQRKIVHFKEFIEIIPYMPRDLTELPKPSRKADTIKLVGVLSLPIDSKFRVTYKDVVYSLAWKKYNIEIRTFATIIQQTFLSLMSQSFTVSQVWCCEIIQQRYRDHLAEKSGQVRKSQKRLSIEIIREYETEEMRAEREAEAKEGGGGGAVVREHSAVTEEATARTGEEEQKIRLSTSSSAVPREGNNSNSNNSPHQLPSRTDSLQNQSYTRKNTTESSQGGITHESSAGNYTNSSVTSDVLAAPNPSFEVAESK